jgi:uncharacterized protein YcaQ
VRGQLLDRRQPGELHDAVRQLTLLQIDPVAAIAPSADLVAWSRLGSSYSPAAGLTRYPDGLKPADQARETIA